MMTAATIEPVFWKLMEADDPATLGVLKAWMPWYATKRSSSYAEGEEVRAELRAMGIDPLAQVVVKHDAIVDLARKAASIADVAAAASAFILAASPDPTHTKYQSPLRAISIIRHAPKHKTAARATCHVCGNPPTSDWSPISAAVGSRRGYTGEDWELLNNAMVARWFAQANPPVVRAKDLASFRKVLKIIADSPMNATSTKVADALKRELGGHIDPWRYFLETLGFAGVLKTEKVPGLLQTWTNASDRRGGPGRSEVPSPARHWRREMGLDPEVFVPLFPHVKLPANLRA